MAQSSTRGFLGKPKTSILLKILILVAGVAIGLFGFILPIRHDVPIAREKAEAHVGYFEKYESTEEARTLYFQDGTEYKLHPYIEPDVLLVPLVTMKKGTKLFLLVNPNNHYVVEVRTETQELLNFDITQKAIFKYNKGHVIIGGIMCIAPVIILLFPIFGKKAMIKAIIKESARQEAQEEKTAHGAHTPVLRDADSARKGKILLSTSVKNYHIVYRRLGFVNELVVNGEVYDEMKAVIEYDHHLIANIDGHIIEAGLDSDAGGSYIRFDGQTVERKKRFF